MIPWDAQKVLFWAGGGALTAVDVSYLAKAVDLLLINRWGTTLLRK